MDIYVPWVQNKNRTINPNLINLLGDRAVFVNLTGNDTGYFSMILQLWSLKRDFMIVEQDNLPIPRDIELMEACPNSWCVCPYKGPINESGQTWIGGLGCVRFRTHLIEQIPNFTQEVSNSWSPNHERFHWFGLDWAITVMLKRRGIQQCWHHEVAHTHNY